jgi:hypothetical protein
MRKLLATTLVCITIISSMAFAETSATVPISEIKPPSGIIPGPRIPEPVQPIDYRSYTGYKISDKWTKEGKVTMQAYNMKKGKKDMFYYLAQYCTYSGNIGTCSYLSSNGWIEGKVAGSNWIVRNGNFDAVLGKSNGIIKYNSMHAILKIE